MPGAVARKADDDHAVMQERGVERRDRHFPPAVLALRAGEDAPDLAEQRVLRPERTGLVEEVPHLRAHVPESRRHAEDDALVVAELERVRDGRPLVELVVVLPGDVVGDELGDALDVHIRARDFRGSLGLCVGHLFDVAPAAVVENEHVSHFRSPRTQAAARDWRRRNA